MDCMVCLSTGPGDNSLLDATYVSMVFSRSASPTDDQFAIQFGVQSLLLTLPR
jgi:hypothetical protein